MFQFNDYALLDSAVIQGVEGRPLSYRLGDEYVLTFSIGAGLGSEVSLADFRKDIVLELLNEAGQVVLAYKIFRCWPSEYQALPELDANAAAIAIQMLKLESEGWERDVSVGEPSEPSFTIPVHETV